jgi:hypothetical protein
MGTPHGNYKRKSLTTKDTKESFTAKDAKNAKEEQGKAGGRRLSNENHEWKIT